MQPLLRILVIHFLAVAIVLGAIGKRSEAQSYSPEHPKVQAMVDRGLAFLIGDGGEFVENSRLQFDFGQPLLVAYTVLKVTGDTDIPAVQRGIEAAKELVRVIQTNQHKPEKIIYEASVAAILLASADPGMYQTELGQIMYFLQAEQKSHGGFGYLDRPTGDTSQVQYAMLALWTINEIGMDVPVPMIEKTLRYMKATMDPSGGWGYQGKISNGGFVKQDTVTKSLATAGICSVIIGGDLLGFYGERKKKKDEDDDVPEAFKRVDLEEKKRRERREVTMSRSDTDGVLQLATRYQNTSRFTGNNWYYYWRYSQERYESFVEIINNKQDKSPDWYNQGVEELASFQSEDGHWGTEGIRDVTPSDVSTSLAILFLIRSTQKAIGKLDAGLTFGGYQLPNDISTIKMVGDKIVSDAETSVENLLKMLEDGDDSGVQVGLLPENLQLNPDPEQRKEQIARLSRLLGSQDPKARQVAARLLGRTEDLNVVPDLIFALTDPNDRVPMLAEESLRLLSRKLTAGNLKQKPTDDERAAAEKFWKQWYLGLRPDYVFIDR